MIKNYTPIHLATDNDAINKIIVYIQFRTFYAQYLTLHL